MEARSAAGHRHLDHVFEDGPGITVGALLRQSSFIALRALRQHGGEWLRRTSEPI
jgi:hypothetical protein